VSTRHPSEFALADPRHLRHETEQALGAEARLFADPRFLARIQSELPAVLDAEATQAALWRAGFLHGFRDARQILCSNLSAAGRLASAASLHSSRLPIQFASPRGTTARPREVHGHWPKPPELRARGITGDGTPHGGCHASAGYTSGWLSGLWDGDYFAVETQCRAHGAPRCEFVAREAASWPQHSIPVLLNKIDFVALKQSIEREPTSQTSSARADAFDPAAPVIHVWGPVMVIPFCGTEESIYAVSLIGRDPGASDVRVVVIDLSGTVLDEAFGALGLECVIEAVLAWGAEPVLAGVNSLSESVVANLERHNLLVVKDIAEAIALAFQVADAQLYAI